MKVLYIGQKVVGTEQAEDKPKLNNHVPWRFISPLHQINYQ